MVQVCDNKLDRNATANTRKDKISLLKRRAAVRKALQSEIADLKLWLGPACAARPYGAEEVDKLLKGGTLPWQAPADDGISDETLCRQMVLRSREMQGIVSRESGDMVEFYTFHFSQATTVLAGLKADEVRATSLDSADDKWMMGYLSLSGGEGFSVNGKRQQAHAVIRGRISVVEGRLEWLGARLEEAKGLVERIKAGGTEEIKEATDTMHEDMEGEEEEGAGEQIILYDLSEEEFEVSEDENASPL